MPDETNSTSEASETTSARPRDSQRRMHRLEARLVRLEADAARNRVPLKLLRAGLWFGAFLAALAILSALVRGIEALAS